jgi:L-alanine-DL-glutamate epimerase-like enolase superfamily enzyme
VKITKIEIFDCTLKPSALRKTPFNPIFLRLTTDTGLTGLGEAGLAYGRGSKAAVGQLRDFAPMILGRDPMKVEALWEFLFRNTFWGLGGGPVVYAGMSAVDIACWDIRGKAMGVPVHQLLGGKTNDHLRTYASQIQLDWETEDRALSAAEDYGKAALKAVAQGYDAVKVDPIAIRPAGAAGITTGVPHHFHGLLRAQDIRVAVDRVRSIREAVGPDVDVIVEVHSYLGVNSAPQLARALEPYDIFFYEEPVPPLNVDSMARVAERTTIPLASGERNYTRWGYRELLEKQALAVAQPDICLVGGITECKKVCDYANIYDATVQVHICGGPVATAAALQVEAVIPNFIIHEHHTNALKQNVRELCKYDYQPVDGKYEVPDRPGHGQELNDAVTDQYRAFVLEP